MVGNNVLEKSIITIMELEDMPVQDRVMLINQVIELVQRRLMVRVIDVLSNEQVDEFVVLLKNGEEFRLNEFVEKNIPDFYEILTEETLRVKRELIEIVAGSSVGALSRQQKGMTSSL